MKRILFFIKTYMATFFLTACLSSCGGGGGKGGPSPPPEGAALNYLTEKTDQFHNTFDVYTDADAAGNHFPARGRMSSQGDEDALPAMDEGCTVYPHSGNTCIEASFKSKNNNWGGWYFMNGVLDGEETSPRENWGDYPNAGFDLTGTTKLTFWARGTSGGERIEFFCLGIGRDPYTGGAIKPYPDSSPKVSLGFVALSTNWRQYTIDLSGMNLSYVLGGFGWVTNENKNNGRNITFYLDDIQYDKPRLADPRFIVSYETIHSSNDFDKVMRNAAFTNDNAVALLAFLVSGEIERAQLLVDAIVYSCQNDRFYDDVMIRNAYQGGDLVSFPGWTPNGRIGTVRMPGWYDAVEKKWCEDKYQISTYTGSVSWAMLALLAFYETVGGDQYLAVAEQMGDWIENNCFDARGDGGYTAGFEGRETDSNKLLYKATDYNIVLYVVFQRLYIITGDEKWSDRADHAKYFVFSSMWDGSEEKFYAGTLEDGVTKNEYYVPLNAQAWAILALREEGESYWGTLDFVEAYHKKGSGFDFNEDCDGIWYEGTAQIAIAFHVTGQEGKWETYVNALHIVQFTSGGLPAASKNGLTTGCELPDGKPWLLFHRAHIGATAWLVLAELGQNPFWIE